MKIGDKVIVHRANKSTLHGVVTDLTTSFARVSGNSRMDSKNETGVDPLLPFDEWFPVNSLIISVE